MNLWWILLKNYLCRQHIGRLSWKQLQLHVKKKLFCCCSYLITLTSSEKSPRKQVQKLQRSFDRRRDHLGDRAEAREITRLSAFRTKQQTTFLGFCVFFFSFFLYFLFVYFSANFWSRGIRPIKQSGTPRSDGSAPSLRAASPASPVHRVPVSAGERIRAERGCAPGPSRTLCRVRASGTRHTRCRDRGRIWQDYRPQRLPRLPLLPFRFASVPHQGKPCHRSARERSAYTVGQFHRVGTRPPPAWHRFARRPAFGAICPRSAIRQPYRSAPLGSARSDDGRCFLHQWPLSDSQQTEDERTLRTVGFRSAPTAADRSPWTCGGPRLPAPRTVCPRTVLRGADWDGICTARAYLLPHTATGISN